MIFRRDVISCAVKPSTPSFYSVLQQLCLGLIVGWGLLGAAVADTVTKVDATQMLAEVNAAQSALVKLKSTLTTDAQNGSDEDVKLRQWQHLAEQFIFDDTLLSELSDKTRAGEDLIQQKSLPEARQLLQLVKDQYAQLIENFELIGKTIDAQQRAEQTRKDSKMYYKMRAMRSLPPKALKAYGVMAMAKRERDQGHFRQALQLWDQAEALVLASFKESVAESASWTEEIIRNADVKREKIKQQVIAKLKDHFVTVPAGQLTMGNSDHLDQSPVHKVTIAAFQLGKTEVAFELWDWCVATSSCFAVPKDEGWGRDQRPVINVSHRDITHRFLPWLNKLTGSQYRLPSEAEWEYAARAGHHTQYSWGDNLLCSRARFDGGVTSVCNAKEGNHRGTLPVANFAASDYGLFDMHGNVWEWVEDCWNYNYDGAPQDSSPWLSGDCGIRVIRGGAWDSNKSALRATNRYYATEKTRSASIGFRLAKSN